MGKYGAGSPYWNRVKEIMILEINAGRVDPDCIDMKTYSIMDLMRSANMSELPDDWRAYAEKCAAGITDLVD